MLINLFLRLGLCFKKKLKSSLTKCKKKCRKLNR